MSTDHDWTEVMLTGFDLSGVDFAAGGFTLAHVAERALRHRRALRESSRSTM
ncbi:MAG: hypothetical protein R2690_04935 [Acidimicrobiales bacterium]